MNGSGLRLGRFQRNPAPMITTYPHIKVDAQGIARVGNSRLKVLHLVAAQKAYKWTATELQSQYPSLSMAQVYAALAYYWDHRTALDAALSAELEAVDEMRDTTDESDAVKALRQHPGATRRSIIGRRGSG